MQTTQAHAAMRQARAKELGVTSTSKGATSATDDGPGAVQAVAEAVRKRVSTLLPVAAALCEVTGELSGSDPFISFQVFHPATGLPIPCTVRASLLADNTMSLRVTAGNWGQTNMAALVAEFEGTFGGANVAPIDTGTEGKPFTFALSVHVVAAVAGPVFVGS